LLEHDASGDSHSSAHFSLRRAALDRSAGVAWKTENHEQTGGDKQLIIANLIGGLGNQMFQYACARALALELNLPLKVTVDMFAIYPRHNGPELDSAFRLQLNLAQSAELRRMIGALRASPRARRVLGTETLGPLRGAKFIAESSCSSIEGLLARAKKGAYLQGYWQSERYFSKHAAAIRSDFTFRLPPTGHNTHLVRAILGSVAVSVHVRRGDYVTNPTALSVLGMCPPDYYFAAIENLQRRVPMARFFAFSDDPQWVTEVLKMRYPDLVVVDGNRADDSYNDMRLMSLCHHHIIANSSFSWWGAWLNSRSDKIVIAPQRWFANGVDARHLLPSTWERM
jgi:hypothetical protein